MAKPKDSGLDVRRRFYPEVAVAGFSHVDWTVSFYSQIAALLSKNHRVLDFGAGRGEPISDDPVPFRRQLVNFRGRCAHVEGCDVDPAVLTNPYLDGARVIEPERPLPYDDACFDLIVSRYVFEHLPDPRHSIAELVRVLKPGGWICAVTPNKYGYVAMAASVVPNSLHARVLSRVQPTRQARDVFPTLYRANSFRALRKHFEPYGTLYLYRDSAEPAYSFNNEFVFSVFKVIHKIIPDTLHTGIFVFFRKG